MATHDFTDDDRLNARVDAILATAFPLAASPDTPIGPLPLWKVRNLLVEGCRARGDDPEPVDDPEPSVADIVEEARVEDGLWQIDALLNAVSALVRDRDFAFDDESCLRLLNLAQTVVHSLLPTPCE